MKARLEGWSIVIAGAWNTRVFSPHWVGKTLLQEAQGAAMTIEVPISSGAGATRYTGGGIIIAPSDDRLSIGVQRADVASMENAERVASKVLELLSHTPVSAVGVNFGYVDDGDGPLRRAFQLGDTDSISALGAVVKRVRIERSIELDGRQMNVFLTRANAVEIDLNFHHDAANADAAREKIAGCVRRHHDLGLNFLAKAYELNLEDET